MYSEEASVYQSYNSYFYCYGSANFTIQLLERRIGTSLNVSADYHDCHLDTVFVKQCSGSGAYTIAGEGSYNISTRYGNVSCFGDVTFYALYATTDGPFCCQGQIDTFVLDGYGYLYDATASYYDNCSSLIDSTDYYYISYDPYTVTSCRGTGAYAFVGNGYFNITVYDTYYSNVGLKCDGSVSDVYYMANGTLHVYSYGQFSCIASGYLSINGTGVIEDDELYCNTTTITTPTPPPVYSCYGTGYNFTIYGYGYFYILFFDDNIRNYCRGELYQVTTSSYQTYAEFYCHGTGNFAIGVVERANGNFYRYISRLS